MLERQLAILTRCNDLAQVGGSLWQKTIFADQIAIVLFMQTGFVQRFVSTTALHGQYFSYKVI